MAGGLGDGRPGQTVTTSLRGGDDGELMASFVVAFQADTAEMGPVTVRRDEHLPSEGSQPSRHDRGIRTNPYAEFRKVGGGGRPAEEAR